MKTLGMLLGIASLLLVSCRSPQAVSSDTEVRDAYFHRMVTSGHAAFQRGDIERAAELYQNAWVRAQQMDRPVQMAASAYNLALCKIALGESEAGLGLLREAHAEMVRVGDPGGDALLAQAEVLRRLDRRPEAWEISDHMLTLSLPRAIRLQNHSLRALLALDEGDVDRALAEREQAHRQIRRQTPIRLLARLAEVDSRIALQQDDVETAAAALDEATALYRDEGRFPDMVRVMAQAAALYARLNQTEAAADRYFRAARHHAAAEEFVEALTLVEAGLSLREEGEVDGSMEERFVRLFNEIQNAMKNSMRSDVQGEGGNSL